MNRPLERNRQKALVITDVQNDFCPGGALAVKDGDKIIPVINGISPLFDRVIATQDWHPRSHVSFASTHGLKPGDTVRVGDQEQILWVDHCVPGTRGAEFHPALNTGEADLILRKGADPQIDSYSVFVENDKKTETGLQYYLKGLGVQDLYLCGLTTDYCVFYSAIDAVNCGFNVHVVLDASKGLDVPAGSLAAAVETMRSRGVRLIDHEHIR